MKKIYQKKEHRGDIRSILTHNLSILALLFLFILGTNTSLKAQFSRGADVSWLRQMEASGISFYNANGTQQDCLDILKSYGINSIRLRVWLNPAGGWSGKSDVVALAVRAKNKGFRIMIDFHYSDTWADPAHQTKPAAWSNHNITQLKDDVYNHTFDVLNTLKTNGVTAEWVQVGNETNNGMLWPEGKASTSMANFAALINKGYSAVKAVNSSTKVIVHLSNGFDNSLFRWMFDGLKNNGVTYDGIGMSVYPDPASWWTTTAQVQTNMNDMVARYGKDVVISEIGLPYNNQVESKDMIIDMINKTKAVASGRGLGVFYWEPQAYNGWQGYSKGAFETNGRPTVALEGFLYDTYNLVTNQGFEAGGVATQTPSGWTEWSNGNLDAGSTAAGGYWGSSFLLSHYKATAYQMTTYQIKTGLANGTYTLRAWVKSGGGQVQTKMYAKNFGGTEKSVAFPTTNTWTQIRVTGINVTNGQCEIGFFSNANAGNWINVDNVEFYKSVSSTARMTTFEEPLISDNKADINSFKAFPTQFRNHLNIEYNLDNEAPVSITLYNTSGSMNKVLLNEKQAKGTHLMEYTSENDAPGLYFVKVTKGGYSSVRKVFKVQ